MLGQGLDSGSKDQMLKDRHRHDSATFGSVGSSSEGSLKENRPDNNNTDHMSKNLNGKLDRLTNNKARNGPRSAAGFKPEGYPKSAPQKCILEVNPKVN